MNHAGHWPADAAVARIGPNAITQVAGALDRTLGATTTRRLFGLAGLDDYLVRLPETMVPETEVMRLHRVMRERLDSQTLADIARRAGLGTGDYLLAHRIPVPAQILLRLLPRPLAARALLAAITRHAWTFAGSGHFTCVPGNPTVLTIADCPICRGTRAATPACDYYAATFERLFHRLVSRRAVVIETECAAMGASHCRFEIRYPR
jgi:divinyl protochlorophyllide a 8-vinyl-reductase